MVNNKFEKFYNEVQSIRGATLCGRTCDLYIELGNKNITDKNIEQATNLIKKYKYKITYEDFFEGPSYCIWFTKETRREKIKNIKNKIINIRKRKG